ncbi:MAG: response regulator [Actinomycetota bacterium]|nr:response regulator transcription factor [Actinomycetota bacterium]
MAQTEQQEQIRVLIVDDHMMVAQGLAKVLSDQPDITVVGTASRVEDAVASARLHQPDVVMMDYELPDGNGVQATERIRADRPETRVVMVTSYTDEHVLIAAIEAGASGYVTKHKVIDEVVNAVRAAHAGEALISPTMLARLLPKLRPSERTVGSDLTAREIEVLKLLAEGLSNQAISDKLVISLHTVRHHVQNIITKLGAHSKLEAVATAARAGVISYP